MTEDSWTRWERRLLVRAGDGAIRRKDRRQMRLDSQKKDRTCLGLTPLKTIVLAFLRPTKGRLGRVLNGSGHPVLMGWLFNIWRESLMWGLDQVHPTGLFFKGAKLDPDPTRKR